MFLHSVCCDMLLLWSKYMKNIQPYMVLQQSFQIIVIFLYYIKNRQVEDFLKVFCNVESHSLSLNFLSFDTFKSVGLSESFIHA